MLNTNIISDFLGLRNVIVTGFLEKDNFIDVYLSTNDLTTFVLAAVNLLLAFTVTDYKP